MDARCHGAEMGAQADLGQNGEVNLHIFECVYVSEVPTKLGTIIDENPIELLLEFDPEDVMESHVVMKCC